MYAFTFCNASFRYGHSVVFLRKCASLSHLFTDFSMRLPLHSPLRALPVAYAAIIVSFLLADPNTYFQKTCRDRVGSSSPDDNQQLAFGSTLAGLVMFGLVLSFFNRAVTVVRLCVAACFINARYIIRFVGTIPTTKMENGCSRPSSRERGLSRRSAHHLPPHSPPSRLSSGSRLTACSITAEMASISYVLSRHLRSP